MDVATTLTFFDRWFETHRERCSVERLDVHHEVGQLGSDDAVRVILTCPVCQNTISGAIKLIDMPDVVTLLKTKSRVM